MNAAPASPGPELAERARAIYHDVVADPQSYAVEVALIAAQARETRQPTALIPALRAQAWVERARLDNRRAKQLLDEAVRIARRHQLHDDLRAVLLTRVAVHHELGRLVMAQRDLDAAAALTSQLSDQPDRADGAVDLWFQQAVLHQSLGQLSRAGAAYRRILNDPRASAVILTKTANNFAIVESQLGHPDAARRLIDYAGTLPDVGPHLRAVVASTRAWISTQTGRLTEGLEEFAVAARLHADAGLPLAEHYLEYVDALTDLRLLPEAYAMAVQAAGELERHGVDLMTGEGQLRVAQLAALQGDSAAATTAAAHARAQFARQRRIPWRARTDVIMGEVHYVAGSATQATLQQVRRAAVTLEQLGLPSYAVDAHLTAGRIALALGRTDPARDHLLRAADLGRRAPVLLRLKAHLARSLATAEDDPARLRHCRVGLRDLAAHRAAFASLELRVRASGHGAELGQLGLRALLRQGTPVQILGWLERTRAAALVAVEPVSELGIDDELAELRAVGEEIDEAQRGGGEPWALLARQRRIEEQIRRRTWITAGGLAETDRPVSVTELRRQLGERVLVEYAVLADSVLAVVVDRRRTRVVQLGSVADLRRAVDVVLFGLRRLSRPARSALAAQAVRDSVEHGLATMRAQLLTPLGLAADQPIVVSPTTGLRRVPWSALHAAPVFVVPAASFWERTARPRERTDEVLLVAGPHLPGAVTEVEQLRGLYPAATVLRPPDSTIEAVLPSLARADVAHVACHGRLRADNPAFSGLQLYDGLLTLHEMDIRGVAPYRMVLASCDSAVEATYDGNEVLGFVSALLARGTCGLVASVVVVPDAASVPLMRGLHERLRAGDSLGEGLHAARAELDLQDQLEFVNWCAFNAYGAA